MTFILRSPEWTDEADLEERLRVVERPPAVAILDFDETLWLRNSTEEFLAAAKPSFLVAVVLQLLGIFKPWRLISRSHPEYYRDWIRVWAVLLIAPWSLYLWRRKAVRLGPDHLNHALLRSVATIRPNRIVVATYGFDIIVRPLLMAIDPKLDLIVSSRLHNAPLLRKTGKGEALQLDLGEETLAASIAVTDNFVDQDLCDRCSNGFYVRWREARYEQAGLTPMIPLSYTARVKRPTENYVMNGVLGYDYAVLWLAYALLSPTLLSTSLALAFYLLAFFAVYEIGYYENDRIGLVREAKPVVSPEFNLYAKHFKPGWAWIFGLALAGIGAAIETVGQPSAMTRVGELDGIMLFGWNWLLAMILIGITRLTFISFNALAPKMRIIPMLLLQLERTLGYVLIFAIDRIGAVLCISHAMGRWIPYVIYRYGGERRDFPAHIASLIIFLSCLPLVVISDRQPIGWALTFEFYVITAYLLARAVKDFLTFRRSAKLLA